MVMSLLLVHLTREKSVKRPSGCFTLPNSDWLLQESEAEVPKGGARRLGRPDAH